MQEKITLSGVPETMLQTVYARARESGGRGAICDPRAEELIGKLDYDFSSAEKETPMRSGVIARTLVLDWLVEKWLAARSRRSPCPPWRTGAAPSGSRAARCWSSSRG